MAHRAIGQDRFDLADRPQAPSSLDALALLIDWQPVAGLLEPLYPAAKGEPGEVFADSAYRGPHFSQAVRAKGGTPRIVATGTWGRDETETQARLEVWNRPIHRVRGRIEKIFGTWKRCYGLRRMRWRGLVAPNKERLDLPPEPKENRLGFPVQQRLETDHPRIIATRLERMLQAVGRSRPTTFAPGRPTAHSPSIVDATPPRGLSAGARILSLIGGYTPT